MAIDFDQIVNTNGNHLTDKELQQLTKIVEAQNKQRSPLNSDEIIIDRGRSVYTKYQWNKPNIDLTTDDMEKGKRWVYGRHPRNETKQDRFIRLAMKRRDAALHTLKLLRNLGSSYGYMIDIPTAKITIDLLEKELKLLKDTYEDGARWLQRKTKVTTTSPDYINFYDSKLKKKIFVLKKKCILCTDKTKKGERYRLVTQVGNRKLSRSVSAEFAKAYAN